MGIRIKITFLIFAFFLSFSSVEAGTLSKPVNNLGLVGYWSFNEGTSTVATDFSGNGNHGTLSGFSAPATPSSGWGSGKLGTGLNFDAVNDFVNLGTAVRPQLPVTVSAWVYLNNYPSLEGGVFSTDKTQPSAHNHAGIWMTINATGNILMGYGSNTACGPSSRRTKTSSNVLSVRKWHLVTAVIRGGADMDLYIDGVDAGGSYSGSGGSLAYSSNNGSVGNITECSTGANNVFPGKIDEVRVYNRSLGSAGVQALYQSGSVRINSSQNKLITNGLVGMWSFDGADTINRIYDRSGQGNDGYMVNMSTSTAKVIGKVGQALTFDGVDDHIRVPSASSLNPNSGSWTVSVWANPADVDQNGIILSKAASSNPYNGYVMSICGNSGCSASGKRLEFEFRDTAFIKRQSFSNSNVTDGNWHMFTAVADVSADHVKLYVDGALVSYTQDNSGAWPSGFSTEPLGIGVQNPSSPVAFFSRAVDEARVYNRALSASEIKTLYNAGAGSKINTSQANPPGTTLGANLRAYWSFNGLDITNRVYDRSGNSNDGYMEGMSTSTAKVIGKIGQALTFDGVDDAVYIRPLNVTTDTMTFTAWVNPNGTQEGYDPIVYTRNNPPSVGIHYHGNGTSLAYTWNDNNVSTYGWNSGLTIPPNEWSFVSVAVDSSKAVATLCTLSTGCSSATNAIAHISQNLNGGFYMGYDSVSSRHYDGKIDEVRIYTRALSTAEVKQLYLLGK